MLTSDSTTTLDVTSPAAINIADSMAQLAAFNTYMDIMQGAMVFMIAGCITMAVRSHMRQKNNTSTHKH